MSTKEKNSWQLLDRTNPSDYLRRVEGHSLCLPVLTSPKYLRHTGSNKHQFAKNRCSLMGEILPFEPVPQLVLSWFFPAQPEELQCHHHHCLPSPHLHHLPNSNKQKQEAACSFHLTKTALSSEGYCGDMSLTWKKKKKKIKKLPEQSWSAQLRLQSAADWFLTYLGACRRSKYSTNALFALI